MEVGAETDDGVEGGRRVRTCGRVLLSHRCARATSQSVRLDSTGPKRAGQTDPAQPRAADAKARQRICDRRPFRTKEFQWARPRCSRRERNRLEEFFREPTIASDRQRLTITGKIWSNRAGCKNWSMGVRCNQPLLSRGPNVKPTGLQGDGLKVFAHRCVHAIFQESLAVPGSRRFDT